MISVYRQTIGPNYGSNEFKSWLTETLLLKSRPNPSTTERPVPFQKSVTIDLCDLYQCKHGVGYELSSIMHLQITSQIINTLLEFLKYSRTIHSLVLHIRGS